MDYSRKHRSSRSSVMLM
ncbi:hypothetical protein LINPERPRIM_LOCUS12818 [Linum perenne]